MRKPSRSTTSGRWRLWRRSLGPEHPNVAASLERYAELLRKTERNAEADRLEKRAKAIRAKLR